jgi:hypothetical protein
VLSCLHARFTRKSSAGSPLCCGPGAAAVAERRQSVAQGLNVVLPRSRLGTKSVSFSFDSGRLISVSINQSTPGECTVVGKRTTDAAGQDRKERSA